jgi:hypothetical protein
MYTGAGALGSDGLYSCCICSDEGGNSKKNVDKVTKCCVDGRR